MSNVNLFDSRLGIQDVLQHTSSDTLPEAKQIASNIVRDISLEDVYTNLNFMNAVNELICPDVGDGRILQPGEFSYILESCIHELKNSDDPKVQALVSDVLIPLLENEELLDAYMGLMVGG